MDEVDPLRDFEIMMGQLITSDTKKAQQEKGSLERMVEGKIGGNDNRVDFKSADSYLAVPEARWGVAWTKSAVFCP